MKIKTLKNRAFVSMSLFLLAAVPLLTFAKIESLEGIQLVIKDIVGWMMNVFWVVAVGFIVWAAFNFLTAQGDAEKVQKAKKMLLYAVIAAVIVLLANGVNVILTNILERQGFESTSPPTGQLCGQFICPPNMYCDELHKTCVEQ